MTGLHGNIITRKCRAYITFKDGGAQICELELENGLVFSLSEMRRWQIQDSKSKRPIKSIIFIKATNVKSGRILIA